ncbi:hypothetical protein GCM10011320_34920 [Neoroseomonas lacus]|uniref:DUF4239 domain-containing protein n=2 Tax=Neoroseomonas lacus TaxID=287609 RepID=A0A917NTV3_9PROT|nr:hypothetical protein GCM10011320_34920 [Neoroseomonas lacus]
MDWPGMADSLYDLDFSILYPLVVALSVGSTVLGAWLGNRAQRRGSKAEDLGMLAGSALGLLALLLAFSFSLALSRFDTRRSMVLHEANAIGSTANFALMLPEPARQPIFDLLREYTAVRTGLGRPYDVAKLEQDVARSVALQGRLWQIAVEVTAASPQSLPVYRFVGSLNEMNNVHESRITAIRYRIPGEVMVMLFGVAMMAMALTGFHSGVRGARRPVATVLMAMTVGVVMTLVADLDRPARGFIKVPVQPLIDAASGMPR